MLINEKELLDLQLKADNLAKETPNPHWKRLYEALADACLNLRALQAMNSIPETYSSDDKRPETKFPEAIQ